MVSTHGTFDLKEAFALAGRPTFLKVNLDTISSNLKIVKSFIGKETEVIACVKGNAYGHGSVPVTLSLEKHGITCFAVGNAHEGMALRDGGVTSDIIVLGTPTEFEIPTLHANHLTPVVWNVDFLAKWLDYCRNGPRAGEGKTNSQDSDSARKVVIHVDTGLKTVGCSAEELPKIMKLCEDEGIPVHSIMTHLVDSWADLDLSRRQLDIFQKAVYEYRQAGVKVHAANTCAVYNKLGTDLDYVRIGVALYGQPLDSSMSSAKLTESLGFRPAVSWYARATKVTELKCGQSAGYCQAYVSEGSEKIAVVPVGYGDGYSKCFTGSNVTTVGGTVCPVVGLVSMDYIVVRLPNSDEACTDFCIMADDYNDVTSAAALATIANTSTTEVCIRLAKRLPRLYFDDGCLCLENAFPR